MKTIRLEKDEYVINDNIVMSSDIELCFAEINEIKDDCIRKVNQCVIWFPTKMYMWVCSAILFFISFFPIIVAFIYRDTELFTLLYLGVFDLLCIPLIIFSCKLGIKKKNTLIKMAKICPAEIVKTNSYKKFYEGTDGGGSWETHYQIDYQVYNSNEILSKKFKFTTAIGWYRKDKGELFDYYKEQKYMFVLLNPKNKKTYPVRLINKDTNAINKQS